MPYWDVILILLAGLFCSIIGLLVRFGPPDISKRIYNRFYRRGSPNARQSSIPPPYASLPIGIVALLMVASLIFLEKGGRWADVGVVLAILWLVGAVPAVVMMHHPPSWLKPRWLREEERRARE